MHTAAERRKHKSATKFARKGARREAAQGAPVSRAKAGEILKHGEIGGRPLTKKQRGLFGAIRGGQKLRRR